MRCTGIEYTSTERTPTVLPELAELLPPLTEEQLAALEADLLANGCYSPVIVNEDLAVVDGHNRLELCQKHDIPYKIVVFSFVDMLEAKQWALDTQKGRRNLDKWELGKIALKLKPDVEARARANQQEYHGNQYDGGLSATLPEVHSDPVDTRKELAETVGLGERTMGKVMQIDEHAPAAVKDALDSGELSINQGLQPHPAAPGGARGAARGGCRPGGGACQGKKGNPRAGRRGRSPGQNRVSVLQSL